jgi:hypothetical protein
MGQRKYTPQAYDNVGSVKHTAKTTYHSRKHVQVARAWTNSMR